MINIRWHDFVRNDDIHRMTEQHPVSSIVERRHLSLFGHLARMDGEADVNQILFVSLP